jgi:hypothetical protein
VGEDTFREKTVIVTGAWGRGLRLYITNPAVRQSIKEMFDVPPEVFQCAGYALFIGRK